MWARGDMMERRKIATTAVLTPLLLLMMAILISTQLICITYKYVTCLLSIPCVAEATRAFAELDLRVANTGRGIRSRFYGS